MKSEKNVVAHEESLEFIRHSAGLNHTGRKNCFFQHTLAEIGFECYLTVDIDKNGKVTNEYYTIKHCESHGEEIHWFQ